MKSLLSTALVLLLMPGCVSVTPKLSDSSSVSVDPEMTMMAVPDPKAQPSNQLIVVVNQSFQEGPLYLTVNETTVEPDEMAIAMTIENRSDRQIRFYPSQGRLSTGMTQIEANLFLSDPMLSGSFAPSEKRSGVLVFRSTLNSKLDLTQVETIHLVLGQVMDRASINPEYVDITVSLAQ